MSEEREQGVGNGEQGTRDEERGTGNEEPRIGEQEAGETADPDREGPAPGVRSPEPEIARMTRRSAIVGVVAAGAAYGAWKWLTSAEPLPDDRLQWPFRRALHFNERLAKSWYSRHRLVREWPLSKADPIPRVNGRYGLDQNADHSGWSLRLEGLASGEAVHLALDDIRRLPKHEMVTELRCIEGWSELIHWGGARLVDLMKLHPPATRDGSAPDVEDRPERIVRYAAMETPGRGYYVGLDMASALHPQTLLAYEINDRPLTWSHGAPLRLVIPVKYGIKNIKRIGLIRYTDVRPSDYWAERKYDWYAGL